MTDEKKTAVVNALVQIAGTNTGVATNERGEYSLGGIKAGEQRLVVQRAGYEVATRDVSVVQGQAVSADVVLTPAPTLLSAQVSSSISERSAQRAAAPPSAPPAPTSGATGFAQGAQQAPSPAAAAGCYEWTVTPSPSTQQRTRFLQVPRRLALDTIVTPSSNEGTWYQARDLAPTNTLPNGSWRPIESGVDVEWIVGTKLSRVTLTGSLTAVMRGTIQEIDRTAGTGEAGQVVAVRRSCE